MLGNVIFITGGVRSGKSAFAEKYATQLYKKMKKENLFYIASGVAFDKEMEARIKRHQQDRNASTIKWQTIDLIDVIPEELSFSNRDVVLWDCITTWLSNVLYQTELEVDRIRTIERYVTTLKETIVEWKESGAQLLVVSNELLDELASHYVEVNLYRKLLGEIHQWFVSISTESYEMDYSIAKRWK